MCVRAHAHVLGKMEKGTRNITKNRGRRLKSHNKKRLNAGMQENYAKSNIFHSTLWVWGGGTRAPKWTWKQTTKGVVVWVWGACLFFIFFLAYLARELRGHYVELSCPPLPNPAQMSKPTLEKGSKQAVPQQATVRASGTDLYATLQQGILGHVKERQLLWQKLEF